MQVRQSEENSHTGLCRESIESGNIRRPNYQSGQCICCSGRRKNGISDLHTGHVRCAKHTISPPSSCQSSELTSTNGCCFRNQYPQRNKDKNDRWIDTTEPRRRHGIDRAPKRQPSINVNCGLGLSGLLSRPSLIEFKCQLQWPFCNLIMRFVSLYD
jgi:hypothetical protein